MGKYIGQWYQVYQNRYTWIWQYAPTAKCGIAQYGLFVKTPQQTVITVRNWNRNNTGDGPVYEIRGFAATTNETGKLDLDLELVPYIGTYWVIKLGPLNADGLYSYSIVTTSSSTSLYVLARDVKEFKEKYDAEVLEFLRTPPR